MRLITLLSMFIFYTVISIAQPSLSNNTSPSVGDSYTIVRMGITNFSIGSSGPDQTWDLSAVQDSGQANTGSVVSASSTPHAANYPTSTVAFQQGDGTYGYYEANSNEYVFNGAYNPYNEVIYTDPETYLQFPFTLGSSFTDSFSGTVLNPSAQLYYRTGTLTAQADAYGTLIMSDTTYTNIVRVHVLKNYQDSINMGGVDYFYIYEEELYQWYLDGIGVAIINYQIINSSFGGNTFPERKNLYYNTPITTAIHQICVKSDAIYPNPARQNIFVNSDEKVNISIYNIIGKKVMTFFEIHKQSMDISALDPGTYIVTIDGKLQSESIKLIVK
ncbi:MAG: hypothetical protein C0594_17665 [Marinilabiliales bacterium]|nr:MAG: hypothetical protein C0594_17665 [Marinilabiliales bacterium]